jgi:uncharacterized protein (TIGR02646 family)
MRPIDKKTEPTGLTGWKKRRSSTELTKWDSLKGEDGASIKSDIKASLLTEQGFVCCYCEQRIESANSHIEHLVSRDSAPRRAFDYSNLLACCLKPQQCGSLKAHKSLKVHPLLPDCREYFQFTSNGHMLSVDEPRRRAAAEESLGILGLGSSVLAAQRKAAVIGFSQALQGMSEAQARAALAQVDARSSQGRNMPFASAILSVFRGRSTTHGSPQTLPRK